MSDRNPKGFRLHPRKTRGRQASSPRAWCSTYLLILRYVRELRAQQRKPRARRPVPSRPYNQRCAVRVMYAKNATRGQWKAHGRYIARESASQGRAVEAGFDATERGINIAARLDQWQSAGDERMWKVIVSPEFGDKIDLTQLTRDLMKRMTRDLDTRLEWVAVAHFNTDNPHVHIALRGVRENGKSFRLERDYIKHGIRSIAEDLCTRQLRVSHATGYRRSPASRSIAAQVHVAGPVHCSGQASRRRVLAFPGQQEFGASAKPVRSCASEDAGEHGTGRSRWARPMAGAPGFRNRTTSDAAPWGSAKDPRCSRRAGIGHRLPLVMFDLRNCTTLEGRILVHGEDEGTGRSFMMLEGTDAKVHCIYHTPQMSEARGRGGLRANRFVRLRKLFENGRPLLEIDELGHCEKVLNDERLLEETRLRLQRVSPS